MRTASTRAQSPSLKALEDILDLAVKQDESRVLAYVLDALRGPLAADVALLVRENAEASRTVAHPPGDAPPALEGEPLRGYLVGRVLRDGKALYIAPEESGSSRWRLGVPVFRDSSACAVFIAEGVGSLPPDYRAGSDGVLDRLSTLLSIAALLDDKKRNDHRVRLNVVEPRAGENSLEPSPPAPDGDSAHESNRRPEDGLDGLFPDIVGRSSAMRSSLTAVADLAVADIPILIEGESGTGKELVAAAIHRLSARSKGPFVSENCGAIPDTLAEAELFGCERGAFTGATRSKAGLLERAHRGTLFLDEIGEMHRDQQKKLLRALQERRIRRIGGHDNIAVDFRIISATNRVLEDLVASGLFREDLFYRLEAATVSLPALRDRTEDIPLLVEHFNRLYSKEINRAPLRFSEEAMSALSSYSWPGNVRELRNEIWRLASSVRGEVNPSQLSKRISGNRKDLHPRCCELGGKTLLDIEREVLTDVVRTALEKADGNLARAAKILGIGRATLYRRMDRYNLLDRKSR